MSIEQFTKDMDIISKLPDEPNDVGGLTAAELKAKFDEGGKALKQYINAVVYPAISGQYTGDLDLDGNRLVNVGAPVQATDAVRKAELDALTAADVGAAEAEHTHTPADLGAAEAEHTHTAADVGAAPAVESAVYPGCYYRTVDGRTEWINPPVIAGTEYRTAERCKGKAVYTVLVSCGTSAAGTAVVDTDFACQEVVRVAGPMGRFGNPFIYANISSSNYTPYSVWASAQMSDGKIRIQVHAGANATGLAVYTQVWYTKE